MSVFGVDDVEAAAATRRLVLGPKDRLTPLARDRAEELEVAIVVAGSSGHAPSSTLHSSPHTPGTMNLTDTAPLPVPPSPALFRRGAPFPLLRGRSIGPRASVAAVSSPTTRVGRVVVVGAGNVGTHAAMRLAETDLVDEIVLVDIVEGLAKGVALDLTHAAGLLRFATRIRGEVSVEAAGRADYTIITAGRPRQPGMSRTDLTATNAEIVAPLARAVGAVSPDGVIIVVTNPLDEMTELAWTQSGLPSSRVIGMAGLLDSARFQALAGGALDARPDSVSALALGSHGDEMIVPLSQAHFEGGSLRDRLGSRLTAIVDRTRASGAEVVGLLGKGSAFITPGLAAATMVEAMIESDGRIVSATVRPDGHYGISGVYVGLPVRLRRDGLAEIVQVQLSDEELAEVRAAAEQIRERVHELALTR